MKTVLFAGASALALAVGAGWALRAVKAKPNDPPELAMPAPNDEPRSAETGEVTRSFLLYFVVPVWIAAGVADWLCHAASDIEHTGGARGTPLPLLMVGGGGGAGPGRPLLRNN